jgi:putative serine protease PepD
VASTGSARLACIVKSGPADSAGLKVGDVVTSLDGKTVTNYDSLTTAVGATKPGEKVSVTVQSKGSTHTVSVTMGSRPASTNNNCSNR